MSIGDLSNKLILFDKTIEGVSLSSITQVSKQKKGLFSFLSTKKSSDANLSENDKIQKITSEILKVIDTVSIEHKNDWSENRLKELKTLIRSVINLNDKLFILSESLSLNKFIDPKFTLLLQKLSSIKKEAFEEIQYIEKNQEKEISNQLAEIVKVLQDRNGNDISPSIYEESKLKLIEIRNILDKNSHSDITSVFMSSVNKKIDGLLAVIANRLETNHSKDIESVKKTYDTASENREKISEIRYRANNRLSNESAEIVSRDASIEIRNFICSLYQDALDNVSRQFGNPPCKFSIVFFGSLARKEAGPYPDIDHMMLIEKKTPETEKYFQKINQFVADSIFRLGESKSLGVAGLRFCEGDMNPIYQGYFVRYSSKMDEQISFLRQRISLEEKRVIKLTKKKDQLLLTGSSEKLHEIELKLERSKRHCVQNQKNLEFLTSLGKSYNGSNLLLDEPLSFAKWQSANEEDRHADENSDPKMIDKIIDQIDVNPVEDIGDVKLFTTYQMEVDRYLDNTNSLNETSRNKVVVRRLKLIIDWLKDSLPITQKKLTPIMDVKQDLYRFPQIIISNLAIQYKIKETNTFDRIRALKDLKIIDADFADKLIAAMNFIVYLRLKTQNIYKEEFEGFSHLSKNELVALKNDYEAEFNELINGKTQINEEIINNDKLILQLEDEKVINVMAEYELSNLTIENISLNNQLISIDDKIKETEETIQRLSKIEAFVDDAHPILSKAEWMTLQTKVLPVLNHLHKITKSAVAGKGNLDRFKTPFVS